MSTLPHTEWRILPMFAEHLPRVLQIERGAYSAPWTESIFQGCLRGAGYSGWVLEDGSGAVFGYAMVRTVGGEAHLLNLCVEARCRGGGLGRMLLEHVITLAQAYSARRVLLEVRQSNHVAMRLYESRGFRRLALRQDHYPPDQASGGAREAALLLGCELA